MSGYKPNHQPRQLWIIMHHGYKGWVPSMDYFCAWSTKKAALWKIKEIDKPGLYKVFKYVPEPTK